MQTVNPQGYIEEEYAEGSRKKIISAEVEGAKIDPNGYLYKEELVDGVVGRMPVVSVDGLDNDLPASSVNVSHSAANYIADEQTAESHIAGIDTALGNKVDKEDGKGLSSNDFTDAYKTQIDTNKQNIEALNGALIYLGDIALNTADMTQQALTNRAIELGYPELKRGYTLVDADANDWVYNGTQWANIGFYEITTATNASLGVVKGSTGSLKVGVDTSGEMSVNGLQTALDEKANTADVYTKVETNSGFTSKLIFPRKTTSGNDWIKIGYLKLMPTFNTSASFLISTPTHTGRTDANTYLVQASVLSGNPIKLNVLSFPETPETPASAIVRFGYVELSDRVEIWVQRAAWSLQTTVTILNIDEFVIEQSTVTTEPSEIVYSKIQDVAVKTPFKTTFSSSIVYYKVATCALTGLGGWLNRQAKIEFYDRARNLNELYLKVLTNASGLVSVTAELNNHFGENYTRSIGYLVNSNNEVEFYVQSGSDIAFREAWWIGGNGHAAWTFPVTANESVLTDNSTLTMIPVVYNNSGLNPVQHSEELTGATSGSYNNVNVYTNLKSYGVGNNAAATGAFVIELPVEVSSTMLSIELDIYNYTRSKGAKILLSGYAYSTRGWNADSVNVSVSGDFPYDIRLGINTSTNKPCIILGDTSSLWSYTMVTVSKVMAGYLNQDKYLSGWNISLATDISNIVYIITPPKKENVQYEEGEWTPTLRGANNVVYNSRRGKYVRVGNKVTVWWGVRATFDTIATGTDAYIDGLPFPCTFIGCDGMCNVSTRTSEIYTSATASSSYPNSLLLTTPGINTMSGVQLRYGTTLDASRFNGGGTIEYFIG